MLYLLECLLLVHDKFLCYKYVTEILHIWGLGTHWNKLKLIAEKIFIHSGEIILLTVNNLSLHEQYRFNWNKSNKNKASANCNFNMFKHWIAIITLVIISAKLVCVCVRACLHSSYSWLLVIAWISPCSFLGEIFGSYLPLPFF